MAQVSSNEVKSEKPADKKAKGNGKFSPKRMASKVGRFFRDIKSEFKKIVWPAKKQVLNNTIVVVVVVALSALVISGFDAILSLLVGLVLQNA